MSFRTIFAATATFGLPLLGVVAAEAASPTDRQAYFGDLHLHTGYSVDAYMIYGTRTTPAQAFEFAQGKPVTLLGEKLQRRWPLDFLAVTDHAEYSGITGELENPNSPIHGTEFGRAYKKEGVDAFWKMILPLMIGGIGGKSVPGFDQKAADQNLWQRYVAMANAHYQPGKFTTLLGYEWTSTPGDQNLHRNVIFRGDSAPVPFTALDSNKPEELWNWLDKLRKDGVEAIAIPHNANASNGLMYDWKNSEGRPIDEAYAQQRALNEPLSEISQVKGQSETHPLLSPNDEFANFELYDVFLGQPRKSAVHGSYIREAYGRGLIIESQVGANPFKFGVVGASDLHTGISVSHPGDYSGDSGTIKADYASAKRMAQPMRSAAGNEVQKLITQQGNLTGVWAEQNTRESIFAALKRKETFATTGARVKVRFFGGWEYSSSLLGDANWVSTAYARGVAMGGDLPLKPASAAAPRFAMWAVKDPEGAGLERAQVVKVWLDNGNYREKVFDVAVGRDAKNAKSEGLTQLTTVWTDPEFDAHTPAVYYLRVLEAPTPRWSTLVARKFDLPLPAGVPELVQGRAWSSPIWYVPERR